MEQSSFLGLSTAPETESMDDAEWDENRNNTINEDGIENGSADKTGLDSPEDSDSFYNNGDNNQAGENDPHLESAYYVPQRDVKLINAHGYFSSHDRQIERLQKDQDRRLQEINLVRLKLDLRSRGLQDQVNDIRNEISLSEERSFAEIEILQARLSKCEQEQINCRESTAVEFTALKDVVGQVYTSFAALEERVEVGQLHRPQQPHFSEAIITVSQPDGSAGRPSNPLTSVETDPGRVSCSLCGNNLSKHYIRQHVRSHCRNRPSRPTPVQNRRRVQPPVPVV